MPTVMKVHGSDLDVWEECIFVEQDGTISIVCHMEAIRQELGVQVSNCFLQGDDVPLPCNLFFDGPLFSSPKSWVPG